MDILANALIVVGISSVALIWVFSVIGVMHIAWDTLSEPLQILLASFKKKR
jgi:uncharacterized membrane protein (Fun14 family)